MPRSFNLAGPCVAAEHYMIPASRRLGDEMLDLVDQKKYFLLRAPRQTGKTTLIFDLVDRINEKGDCHALYCSLAELKTVSDLRDGIDLLIDLIMGAAYDGGLPNSELLGERNQFGEYVRAFRTALSKYCKSLDKPLAIFFDEVDSLSGDLLIGVLCQIREGYVTRSRVPFPHSLALVGMRDLKDYKHDPSDPNSIVGNTSPFNIAGNLVLRNFTAEEVAELYGQHTAETGQTFTQEALDLAFLLTQGQPWLVNAIGDRTTRATASDPDTPVTEQMVREAAQSLILSRDVHIDSLGQRLMEPRVQKVLEPIVAGGFIEDRLGDDYRYVTDLGLLTDDGDRVQFANPIYGEVILQTLTSSMQDRIKNDRPDLVLP